MQNNNNRIEWLTLLVIGACYGVWAVAVFWLPLWAGIGLAGVAIALHASLQHEVIHGHPTPHQRFNDILIGAPLILTVPYLRFRDTHLAHHHDEVITDPYDDPESNFLDGGTWDRLPVWLRAVLTANNTVAGRLLIGPVVGTVAFVMSEWRVRDKAVLRGWLWHIPSVAAVMAVVVASPMPVWAYLLATYLAMAILKLRTYLEHRAHDRASGRSVIVERGGIFGFLFLNNNLHVVHHMHPRVAWYDLPAVYRARKDHYLRRNDGYFYASYTDVIRRYLFRAKDPVAHPLWRR